MVKYHFKYVLGNSTFNNMVFLFVQTVVPLLYIITTYPLSEINISTDGPMI